MRVDEGDKINILGIDLHRVDYEEACKRVSDYLKLNTCRIIVTPNAEIIMAARTDKEIKTLINSSDICLPDGIGVVLASKILGKPLSERTTGFDFMMKMLVLANQEGLSFFLLGGKPGIAELAGNKIISMFPNVRIAGTYHGYFNKDEEHEVVNRINENRPDILLVAMGYPKQEMFMLNNKEKLKVRVAMGVGGSLDVLSGTVRRAPVFMQKAGLEWLYRLVTQPSRFKRMSVLPIFLIKVVMERLFFKKGY